jgi:hypothetical protein
MRRMRGVQVDNECQGREGSHPGGGEDATFGAGHRERCANSNRENRLGREEDECPHGRSVKATGRSVEHEEEPGAEMENEEDEAQPSERDARLGRKVLLALDSRILG